jgi:cellobiose-specific phosphotransferase system component IIB
MKIVSYAEIKETGILLNYPSKAVKEKMQEVVKIAHEKSSGFITCDIKRVYKSRSNEQNRMFWGIVQQIASETGNELEDIEAAVKERATKRGYGYRINKLTGRIMPYSMTEVDTIQMGYLLEEVIQLAAELGIVVEEIPK